VIVLQTLHGMSDSETTDAITFDLRWKAAVGWPLTAKAFHDTTLTYWRRRLAASQDPNRIFTAVQTVIAQTGALKGKTRRALDSTVLDDAVATQDTVTQLIAAIRRVRREVPGAAAVVARVTSAHDYDDPGKPRIAWNDKTARATLAEAGHDTLIKPIPLRAPVPGGFTADDFTVDHTARTVTCPAGKTRPIPASGGVSFKAACRGCPLRAQCTTARDGRCLTLSEHDELLRAARRNAETDAFQQPYRQHRPMVERSIAWLVRGGNRKVRYRGIANNDLWLHHRLAGLNLRRLLNLGLHQQHGSWALA